MYCRVGNETRVELIGYIEPITTGAPWRFAAGFATAAAADVVDDVVVLLLPALEHAAAASVTQTRPEAQRIHLVAIISPYVFVVSSHSLFQRTAFQDTLFRTTAGGQCNQSTLS
jgi:hypothetical protein